MKYIKKYENVEGYKYDVGDIVIVKFSFWSLNHEKIEGNALMYITDISRAGGYNKKYWGISLPKNSDKDNEITFNESDVIEKVSPEDAEMYINTIKYNL